MGYKVILKIKGGYYHSDDSDGTNITGVKGRADAFTFDVSKDNGIKELTDKIIYFIRTGKCPITIEGFI